jgi:hypothetical protein
MTQQLLNVIDGIDQVWEYCAHFYTMESFLYKKNEWIYETLWRWKEYQHLKKQIVHIWTLRVSHSVAQIFEGLHQIVRLSRS